MNKHFEDALYYLRRAGTHAKLGIGESLEHVRARGRRLLGRESEPEPEPSHVDALLEDVKDAERKAEGDARRAIGAARERLENYRSKA